ncbi:MAG: efflux RND transporter periplasmic adaptor subunit [Calditrichota bacterium]
MFKYTFYFLIIGLFCCGLAGCSSRESHADHDHAATEADMHDGDRHESEADNHEDEHSGEESDLISFSTELQREFGIETIVIERRAIHETINTIGEVKAAGARDAEVVAPFAGILHPDAERGIVRPGQRVAKGDPLAVIAPSAEHGGWYQLWGDYQLAKAEYERIAALNAEGAVAPKRMQEALYDLTGKETRLRAAIGGLEISALDSGGSIFHLRAPISGILSDVHLRFGQHVDAGEHLFNIVDPSRVWLEAQVPVSESGKLDQIRDAYFTISGSDEIFRTADLNGRLVSVGGLLDPATRRVPVIFEIDNPDNRFKPGSYIRITLRSGTSHEALVVPQSAVVDEDGIPIVIVQAGPQDFRKAILETGAKEEHDIEVTAGLTEGERVVTKGAYKIKLAAIQTGGTDAHAGHGH